MVGEEEDDSTPANVTQSTERDLVELEDVIADTEYNQMLCFLRIRAGYRGTCMEISNNRHGVRVLLSPRRSMSLTTNCKEYTDESDRQAEMRILFIPQYDSQWRQRRLAEFVVGREPEQDQVLLVPRWDEGIQMDSRSPRCRKSGHVGLARQMTCN